MCIALALFVAGACGGGNDDDDDDDAKPEVDLIALVAAAFDEAPRRLPEGLTLSKSYFDGNWRSGDVATIDYAFTGPNKTEGHAVAVIYRRESDARTAVTEENDYLGGTESKQARGRYCVWDDFTTYINIDFSGSSVCLGRVDNILLEAEFGEVGDDRAEAAIELLQAMERYFEGLLEDSTERVREVKPEALATLLSALPPPGPKGMEFATDPSDTFPEDDADDGLVLQTSWRGEPGNDESVFVMVYQTAADATAYREENAASAKNAGETTCAASDDRTYRYCVHQLDEVIVFAQRKAASENSPAVDPVLQEWTDAVVEHVESVRSGRLPKSPKVTPTPSGTRTPTQPPAPPTATPTPLPQVSRFNAGTWTLPVVVTGNTCPDGPAVGTQVLLEYELTDSDGDGYIYPGELFGIEQLKPDYSDLGATYATLPTTRFAADTSSGTRIGGAILELTFTAENEALVAYVESYGSCSIRAQ